MEVWCQRWTWPCPQHPPWLDWPLTLIHVTPYCFDRMSWLNYYLNATYLFSLVMEDVEDSALSSFDTKLHSGRGVDDTCTELPSNRVNNFLPSVFVFDLSENSDNYCLGLKTRFQTSSSLGLCTRSLCLVPSFVCWSEWLGVGAMCQGAQKSGGCCWLQLLCLAEHAWENGHSVGWDNVKMLSIAHDFSTHIIREAFAIHIYLVQCLEQRWKCFAMRVQELIQWAPKIIVLIIASFCPLPACVPKSGVILCNCIVYIHPFLCIYLPIFSQLSYFTDDGCCIVTETSVSLFLTRVIKRSKNRMSHPVYYTGHPIYSIGCHVGHLIQLQLW